MAAVVNVPGPMVPITFKYSGNNNEEEVTSKILSGAIALKAAFLRDFLVTLFGERVEEQTMFFNIDLLAQETTDGLSLLKRAKALTGVVVSMAMVCPLDGAFVVRLPQLKEHPGWKTWSNTPEDPHITLAFIEDDLNDLPMIQRRLICLALSKLAGLAVDNADSYTLREDVVRVVWNYLNVYEPNDHLQQLRASADIKKLFFGI